MLTHVCLNIFLRGGMLFTLLCLILSTVGDKSGKELPSFRGQLHCLQFPSICHGVKHRGPGERMDQFRTLSCLLSGGKWNPHISLLRKVKVSSFPLPHEQNLAWSYLDSWVIKRILGYSANTWDLAASFESSSLVATGHSCRQVDNLAFINFLPILGQVNNLPLWAYFWNVVSHPQHTCLYRLITRSNWNNRSSCALHY